MSSFEASNLAVFGGTPAFPDGPPEWPRKHDDIREAMLTAWEDGSWGRYAGDHCDRLVSRLKKFHVTEHAMLTSSGTIAVELALRSVGVTENDRVLLAGYDFPGNFRAVEAIGARPVLFDLAENRFVPSPEIIEDAISQSGSPVSAILVSHLHGDLVDMPATMQAASRFGIPVVEDACQATGATIASRRVGSFGDVGVLSFGGSKLLTAGRGGALLSDNASIMQRCKVYCERGNNAFPLSELQAAVLLPQLARLDADTAVRAVNARKIAAACFDVPGLEPVQILQDTWVPGVFKFGMRFDATQTAWASREGFLKALTSEGIAVGAGFRGFAKRSARRCDQVRTLHESIAAAGETIVLHHPILLRDNIIVQRLTNTIDRVATANFDR